ncbi:hypothetical protein O1611_g3691 [Lasiodiplodia mahajangana]|uniref:Uncharacterized protein n=1 Tax=Lasiodiplodia mahajangana TaxID=1108764 RepID=A0ACC2JR68_9PEZI|nr:hypothetical protein O1611_g3691 [Lasiodiplodia mahajangana]
MSNGPDDIEKRREQAEKIFGIMTNTAGGLNNFLNGIIGKETRQGLRKNLAARGNIPSIEGHFVPRRIWRSGVPTAPGKLWIVDRILAQQSIGQFIIAAMCQVPLPTGEMLSEPFGDEWVLITRAYSEWAPPPFNAEQGVPIDKITHLIGSMEETGRMQLISKELQAMKARLWEGIMPVSARRWREKELYDPDNFSIACRTLSMAINVFGYLNLGPVQIALRETFLLINGVLQTFENALNAKRALEGKPAVEVSKRWYQFIRAKYAAMENRTHGWVMEHVGHMKDKVLEQLDEYAASHVGTEASDNDELMRLYDKWQDLSEISAQADYTILMPMDGYDGSGNGSAQPRHYDFLTEPLRVEFDLNQRRANYHSRRGHLVYKTVVDTALENRGDPKAAALDRIVGTPRRQDAVQKLVRAELRGEPVRYDKEPWAIMLRDVIDEWGFVIYRSCHSCTDDDWDNFRAKFDVDQADWGSGLVGVEKLRERSKLHWLDAKDLGIEDGDVEALKSSFRAFTETADFPVGFAKDMFLMVDEASVASYLNPTTESSPPGDAGGFVCAVEADFDPAQGPGRPDESPGYGGTLRVLGSLLWDDLSALIASHSQHLESLWPLAMNHPSHVYVGAVLKVHKTPSSS